MEKGEANVKEIADALLVLKGALKDSELPAIGGKCL